MRTHGLVSVATLSPAPAPDPLAALLFATVVRIDVCLARDPLNPVAKSEHAA